MATFIRSVIVWLSDFPMSPLLANDSRESLTSPEVFNALLLCLMGKSVKGTVELYPLLIQEHLESKVETKMVKEMKQLVVDINFKMFFTNDLHSCVKVCVLLYFIGTHTSTYANLGITSLGFLREEDKTVIDLYMQIHSNELMVNDILKDFDSFELTLCENQIEQFLSLKYKAEEVLQVLQSFNYCNDNNNLETKSPDAAPSSASSYVDEEYIDSILWENKLLEDTLYKLMLNKIT